MQKIVPNLWFDGTAEEAVGFYTAIFPSSKITSTANYPASVEEGLADFQLELAGKVLTVEFELAGHAFTAINAGPGFVPTPAISFMVNFDSSQDDKAEEHINEVWEKLLEGGQALMPLDKYAYSKRYGWVQDKYGFTWQLILTNPEGEERPCIIPSLLFSNGVQNQAEAAIDYYLSVFQDTQRGAVAPYPENSGPAKEGSVMFADFLLENQWFAAMDSGVEQDFTFNEAVSFAVYCKDQAEIDYYWERLSAFPENEQCGWCKDRFGVSWQIVPANMEELMKNPDAFKVLMRQKKIVLADYENGSANSEK